MPQTTVAFPNSTVTAGGTGLSPTAWTNPNNAQADDATNATSSGAALTGSTQVLTASQFNMLSEEPASMRANSTGQKIPAGASILGIRFSWDLIANNGTLTFNGASPTGTTTSADQTYATNTQAVRSVGWGTLAAGSTVNGGTFAGTDLSTAAGQLAARAKLANANLSLYVSGGAGGGVSAASYGVDFFSVTVQWVVYLGGPGGARSVAATTGGAPRPFVTARVGQGTGGSGSATATLRPNGDVSGLSPTNTGTDGSGWAYTPSTPMSGYDKIDDPVTQPTVPDLSDYVSCNASGPLTVVFDATSQTLPSGFTVSGAVAWFYWQPLNTSGGQTMVFELRRANNTVLATTTVTNAGGSAAARWTSITYSGALTQAEVDGLRLAATVTNTLNGTTVYAAYVDVSYTYPLASSTAGPRVSGGAVAYPLVSRGGSGAVVASSRAGGQPQPLVTKLAAGAAVIASRAGGQPQPVVTRLTAGASAITTAAATTKTVVSEAAAGALARATSGGQPKPLVTRGSTGGRAASSVGGGQPKPLVSRGASGAVVAASRAGGQPKPLTRNPGGAVARSVGGGVARVFSFSISGYARNSQTNAPIAGVRCKVYRFSDDSLMGTAISDATGYYAVAIPGDANQGQTFWVRFWKAGSPNMFATTDDDLPLVVSQVQGPPLP